MKKNLARGLEHRPCFACLRLLHMDEFQNVMVLMILERPILIDCKQALFCSSEGRMFETAAKKVFCSVQQ